MMASAMTIDLNIPVSTGFWLTLFVAASCKCVGNKGVDNGDKYHRSYNLATAIRFRSVDFGCRPKAEERVEEAAV
jgi:hypothetical protein